MAKANKSFFWLTYMSFWNYYLESHRCVHLVVSRLLHVLHKLCLRGGSMIGGPTKNIMVNLTRPIELWKNRKHLKKYFH
jgi:hypothetical protein